MLQSQAWNVADQLGWETTYDAEYVALTQLQADAFVTSDGKLARTVSGQPRSLADSQLTRPRIARTTPARRSSGKGRPIGLVGIDV